MPSLLKKSLRNRWKMTQLILFFFSLLISLILTLIVHYIYSLEIVYTHFYYIPIILAGIWYPKYAFLLGLFLAFLHVSFDYMINGRFLLTPILRSSIFLLVSFVTSQVTLTKDMITAKHKKIHEEMKRAKEVHNHILPKKLPEIEGISLSTYYQPTERIGGDFYDFISLDNQVIFYLSDVSGHGLDSSMLSLFVKHTIKGCINFTQPHLITPKLLLQYLTREFQREGFPEEYFVCIFLGILKPHEMELIYGGMGFHNTPLVKEGNGHKTVLTSKSLFISPCLPFNYYQFKEKKHILTPGTTILFNTDGLTEEIQEGISYRERLKDVFYKNADLSPSKISQIIVEDFCQFNQGSPQGSDDITFLILQVDKK